MQRRDFSSVAKDFSSAVSDEISMLLKRLAEPVEAGESIKACISRAAERSGLTFHQTRHAWYREWTNIPAHVADQIRQRAAEHDRKLKAAAFQTILAMQESDPDLYRQCIEELGDLFGAEREARRAGGGRN